MSRMLSLSYWVWTRARAAGLVVGPDSRRRLEHVVAMNDLPASELVKAHRLLAEIAIEQNDHPKARRELRQAIALAGESAELLLALARTWEDDPLGSDLRAAKCYRQAVRINPNNSLAWARLGRACLRLQRDRLAKRCLQRAIRLSPADEVVVGCVVEALLESGRNRAALKIASQARFLNSKSKAIRSLVDRVRFTLACRKQNGRSKTARHSQTLPFVRVIGVDGRQQTVRTDPPSSPRPTLIRFRRG